MWDSLKDELDRRLGGGFLIVGLLFWMWRRQAEQKMSRRCDDYQPMDLSLETCQGRKKEEYWETCSAKRSGVLLGGALGVQLGQKPGDSLGDD